MMKSSITESVLLDSNILIRAYMPAHPDYALAQSVLGPFLLGERLGAIAQQNLLEFYATITNPKRFSPVLSSAKASHLVQTLLTSELTVIAPRDQTIGRFLALQDQLAHPPRGQGIYDLYLAATALEHDITTILTENVKDFRHIPGITAVNPFIEAR